MGSGERGWQLLRGFLVLTTRAFDTDLARTYGASKTRRSSIALTVGQMEC